MRWHLETVRPIDDFIWGTARFSMPNVNDLEKWNNRIVQNLLYYQTNYFYVALIIYGIFAFINFTQTLYIITIVLFLIGEYTMFFVITTCSGRGSLISDLIPKKALHHVFIGSMGFAIFVLYLMSAVLTFLLMLLLPIFIAFLHASIRMRNINNKISNILYQRIKNTPMAMILNSIDRIVIEGEGRDR